jgi:hypothetical protein
MQTTDIITRHQDCRLLEPVGKRVPIGQLAHHFQRAVINIDLFGPGIGAIFIISALLISLFQHSGHLGADKGVM